MRPVHRDTLRQLQLTAQAYRRVPKLSRVIAELAGSEATKQVHLGEALQYGPKLELRKIVSFPEPFEICNETHALRSLN